MSRRVLLLVLFALAGCASKVVEPTADAGHATNGPSSLGSGTSAMPDPSSPIPGAPVTATHPSTKGSSSAAGAGTTSAAQTSSATGSPAASTSDSATNPSSPAIPSPVTQACTVAMAGPGSLAAPVTGICSPADFVSSTGAPFTHAVAQVVSSASSLPAAASVQVKDAAGNVLGSGSGLGTFQVPMGSVPATPDVPLTVVVSLLGTFHDYSATVTVTLS